MATATPERVQLDRYFYRVIITKQSNPKARVWLLERDGSAPPSTIYGTQRAAKTFDQADEASVVNELSNWAVMHHTHVLPLIKISRLDFRIAALMELCPGTLQDVIEQRPLSWPETRAILVQVTEALRYALDEHQMAHLDIKPANIMIKTFPSHVQVSDWGISKITQKGKVVGFGFTPGFLPPERMTGKPVSGAASDIFALGMTAILALTQRLPYLYQQDQSKFGTFDEQRFRQLHSHQYFQNATHLLAPLPPPIQNLLLGMIHPDPSTRFADYARLTQAIEGVAA